MDVSSFIIMLLQGAGFTKEKIEKLAVDEARSLAKQQLQKIFTKAVPEVSKRAQEEGWLVGQVKSTRAQPMVHALTEHEVVRDVIFRLWRHVYAFHGGGHIADAFRDREEQKVGQIVEPRWDGTQATYTQMVQWTADAIRDLVF